MAYRANHRPEPDTARDDDYFHLQHRIPQLHSTYNRHRQHLLEYMLASRDKRLNPRQVLELKTYRASVREQELQSPVSSGSKGFMDLPKEFRFRVYLEAVGNVVTPSLFEKEMPDKVLLPHKLPEEMYSKRSELGPTFPQLRLVSKQVSMEATEIVLQEKEVVFDSLTTLVRLTREPSFDRAIAPWLSHITIELKKHGMADLLQKRSLALGDPDMDPLWDEESPWDIYKGAADRARFIDAMSKLKLKSFRLFLRPGFPLLPGYGCAGTEDEDWSSHREAYGLIRSGLAKNPLRLNMMSSSRRYVRVFVRPSPFAVPGGYVPVDYHSHRMSYNEGGFYHAQELDTHLSVNAESDHKSEATTVARSEGLGYFFHISF